MKKAQKQVAAIGAGVAALAAAAAGTYFFAGKGGAKNRKKVAAWTHKAKREVMQEMHKMEKVSEKAYHKTVDMVMDNYKNVKNIDKQELAAIAGELKNHWKAIASEVKQVQSKIKKALPAKKAAPKKSPAKKASPKKRR